MNKVRKFFKDNNSIIVTTRLYDREASIIRGIELAASRFPVIFRLNGNVNKARLRAKQLSEDELLLTLQLIIIIGYNIDNNQELSKLWK